MPATLLHVDSRKRVTLPIEAHVAAGEDLELEVMKDGRLMLTPIVRVPRNEAWAMSQEVELMLKNYLNDDSPLIDLSKQEGISALRAEIKKHRK